MKKAYIIIGNSGDFDEYSEFNYHVIYLNKKKADEKATELNLKVKELEAKWQNIQGLAPAALDDIEKTIWMAKREEIGKQMEEINKEFEVFNIMRNAAYHVEDMDLDEE